MENTAPLDLQIDHPDLLVGILRADGVAVGPSDAALLRLVAARVSESVDQAAGRALAGAGAPDERASRRAEIRDLLRRGGYKPTGRGKPSSEYIANAAERDEFPVINDVVDITNLVSLECGLPISMLDLDRALGGAARLEIRFGRPGESYVFNASGQSIDVSGLVCIARADGEPVGNPVKDAMVAKTDNATRRVVAVIYGPNTAAGSAETGAALEHFASLLVDHAGASDVRTWMLPVGSSR